MENKWYELYDKLSYRKLNVKRDPDFLAKM